MNRDFTLNKYKELLETLTQSNLKILTIDKYIKNKSKKNIVIIRHDIDKNSKYSFKMAKIEHEFGISSTYYFRMKPKIFDLKYIQKISDLGHEIGYHYETLDKAKGNYEIAIKLFEAELKKMRKYFEIKTICMHGNPLSKFDNRDLWKRYDFSKFGIKAEAYLSIDFDEFEYLSDTGRCWDQKKYKIKDTTNSKNKISNINSTDDIIDLIKSKKLNNIYLLTHPERWADSFKRWAKELCFQKIKNIGKQIMKH